MRRWNERENHDEKAYGDLEGAVAKGCEPAEIKKQHGDCYGAERLGDDRKKERMGSAAKRQIQLLQPCAQKAPDIEHLLRMDFRRHLHLGHLDTPGSRWSSGPLLLINVCLVSGDALRALKDQYAVSGPADVTRHHFPTVIADLVQRILGKH